LNRRNAEFSQIRNSLDDSCEGASLVRRDSGARVCGKAANVHLVDDGARPRMTEPNVAGPVISASVDQHALHRSREVAVSLRGSNAVIAFRNYHSSTIRVENRMRWGES